MLDVIQFLSLSDANKVGLVEHFPSYVDDKLIQILQYDNGIMNNHNKSDFIELCLAVFQIITYCQTTYIFNFNGEHKNSKSSSNNNNNIHNSSNSNIKS